MLSAEEQKQLDRNIQRTGMFHALRNISAIVQQVENEKQTEAKAIKIALGVLGAISIVTLFYVLIQTSNVKPPPPTIHVASNRFTNYVNDWAKQVQSKLSKSCINLSETGSQTVGVILSTSIMKDGTVEKVMITKSSGIKELDEAAVRDVLAAAPFAPLTPEIKQDTDILTITRTFRREPCPQK